MNVLVIGSGGRESAIAWAVKKSPKVKEVFTCPGNGGTLKYGDNLLIDLVYPYAELLDFVEDAHIDLTIVGPEKPLTDGIVDVFRKTGNKIFGPKRNAARLEASKVFMKEFMKRNSIPTARFEVFNNANDALSFVDKQNKPFVVKTDGLAAGKGAIVNNTIEKTKDAIHRVMVMREFGPAGDQIVIEDLLEGTEVSVFVVTDGIDYKWMASAQDHKRIGDLDEGPNTGGMGAYAPFPFIDKKMKNVIDENIIKPTIDGMRKEGNSYEGILYIGLMLTKSGPIVLEYNVRLGDPEAQVVLPLLETDFIDICSAVTENRLQDLNLKTHPGFCCGVVLASEGYPGKYQKGFTIEGDIRDENDRVVFHAGTKRLSNGSVITDGGRVMCVSALGKDLETAIDRAYKRVEQIHFDGMYYRKDIGRKGLKSYEKQ